MAVMRRARVCWTVEHIITMLYFVAAKLTICTIDTLKKVSIKTNRCNAKSRCFKSLVDKRFVKLLGKQLSKSKVI